MLAGINLHSKKILSCKIKLSENNSKFIFLQEGRNRQIRSLVKCLGFKVADLRNTMFGSFSLDSLKEGDWEVIKALNFEDIK